MRFRWQNLNEPNREGKKRYWLHGRTWVSDWSIEWCLPHWAPGVAVSFRMPGVKLAGAHACGGPIGIYLHNQRHQDIGGIRSAKLYWFAGTFYWSLWDRQFESRKEDPWWVRTHSFNPADFLLGRMKHEHEILSEYREVLVPMPEGCYKTKMREERRTWTRPRFPWWPFTHQQQYIEIEIEGGIPFEGKGENSWDCGEDGLWGCSSSTWSYEKAIAHVVESVLESRKRYGGSWVHRGREVVMAAPREKP